MTHKNSAEFYFQMSDQSSPRTSRPECLMRSIYKATGLMRLSRGRWGIRCQTRGDLPFTYAAYAVPLCGQLSCMERHFLCKLQLALGRLVASCSAENSMNRPLPIHQQLKIVQPDYLFVFFCNGDAIISGNSISVTSEVVALHVFPFDPELSVNWKRHWKQVVCEWGDKYLIGWYCRGDTKSPHKDHHSEAMLACVSLAWCIVIHRGHRA